jgi:D-threo-aldose 1-dehydrogenase
MPALVAREMSLIAGGVFNSGLLIAPRPGATYNYAPAPDDLLAKAQRLERACAQLDVPLRAAAIQFPLAHPAVATVVVGARSAAEVDDTIAMIQLPIPQELWTRLKELELIREDAPVPSGS